MLAPVVLRTHVRAVPLTRAPVDPAMLVRVAHLMRAQVVEQMPALEVPLMLVRAALRTHVRAAPLTRVPVDLAMLVRVAPATLVPVADGIVRLFVDEPRMPCLANCSNKALNPAPFGRWTLRDKAAQRRLALR